MSTAEHPTASVTSRLSDSDLFWFNEGTHRGLANKLGGHPCPVADDGATFAASVQTLPMRTTRNRGHQRLLDVVGPISLLP